MSVKRIAIFLLVEVFILGAVAFFLINRQKPATVSLLGQTKASISGTIDLNGAVTADSTINILVKKSDEKQFATVVDNLPAQDGIGWSWNNATADKIYDLKAVLYINGQKQDESGIVTVTAPAAQESLRINSTYVPATSTTTAINGKFDLNGFVGKQNTLSLFAKEYNAKDFLLIASNIKAVDGVTWSWAGGQVGKIYQIKAVLYNGVSAIGESTVITVAPPAENEVLRINSINQPPPSPQPGKAIIWGSVQINGAIPAGSLLTVYKKAPADSQYVQITQLSATDNVQWGWNSATAGVQYLVKAVLANNNIFLGESPELTVTAPAGNEVLTINIGSKLPKPPNGVSYQCNSLSNNNWTVTLNYQAVNNAQTYWIEVGDQPGNNNIINAKVPTNNQSNQTFTMNNVVNNNSYYVQYAYANCSGCTDSASYSFFSNMTQMMCSNNPTATPTPAPTNTPVPTATATPAPSPTATPTPTPKIAHCNETCGSAGYTCDNGLTCISQGGLGSDKCRNPNCPDEIDCICPPQ